MASHLETDAQQALHPEQPFSDTVFWERLRREFFPAERINLNPNALSAPSVPVREAIRRFRDDEIEAFPIGSYSRGREAMRRVRRRVERVWPQVGAPAGVGRGTTAVLGMLGTALYPALASRNGGGKLRLLMSGHEHTSAGTGFGKHAGFETITLKEGEETNPQTILARVKELKPDVLFLSVVTYDMGRWLPVEEVLEALDGAPTPRVIIVNATQAIGICPRLPALGAGARIMMGSAHKWLFAPHGTGLLWMTPEAVDLLEPYVCVGDILDPDSPLRKFEPGGGQDFSRLAGVEAALELYANVGPARVLARSTALARWFLVELDRILKDRGIHAEYYGAGGKLPDPSSGGLQHGMLRGVLSVNFEDLDPYLLYTHLNSRRIHTKCIKKTSGDGRPLRILRFGFPCFESLSRLDAVIREIEEWKPR